jgi:hypothetical protein
MTVTRLSVLRGPLGTSAQNVTQAHVNAGNRNELLRLRQPDPSLIKQEHATERGELIEERLEFGHGPGQLDVAGERRDVDELDWPVAEHLIRQAQIAELGV